MQKVENTMSAIYGYLYEDEDGRFRSLAVKVITVQELKVKEFSTVYSTYDWISVPDLTISEDELKEKVVAKLNETRKRAIEWAENVTRILDCLEDLALRTDSTFDVMITRA
jgi:hypothetical protein